MARRIGLNSIVFILGFVVCAITLHELYGSPILGQSDGNTHVVMAALETPVAEPSHTMTAIEMAARQITPAVVTIDTESKPIPVADPFGGDPFFRQWFGGGGAGPAAPQTERERGVGSGVLISADGYILTNDHVVANADAMKVTLYDGKEYHAKLIGTDPTTDIAVCKIDTAGVQLPYAQLGDSKSLLVGQQVIAVGNPLDVGTTVTSGIVSAIGHRNQIQAGERPLANDIIQTDTAINPGNSGGALADLDGHVVGINEAIYSENGGFIGIGFAIPINTARNIAEQLITTGSVVRPYIGISYEPLKAVDDQSRQQIGIAVTGDDGAIVIQVAPDSPAAEAGLQQYDVILEANRQKITSDSTSMQDVVNKLKPGDKLVLLVDRGGHQMLISVTVKQMPKDFGANMDQQNQQNQQQGPEQAMPPDNGNGGGNNGGF
jgi:S1-C subfamily serine protease